MNLGRFNTTIRVALTAMLLAITAIIYAGTPHMVSGTVTYSEGGSPSSAGFTAYIKTRSGETQTQSAPGCGYSGGYYWVQCGNFPTSWSAGDVLHIDINDGAGRSTSGEVTLTNDANDPLNLVFPSSPSKSITVTTDPSGLSFTVDGTTYTSAHTFSWQAGSNHTLAVSSPLSGGTGTRYIYSSWSDGGNQSHAYTVPSSDQTVTANFTTQYYLTVSSTHGSPTGEGWYNSGASASFGVTTPESGGTGTQYTLTSWTGSGSGSYSGAGASHSVTMNGPITETAGWKTLYYLTTAENPDAGGDMTPAPPGGWYDNGAVVNLDATIAGGYTWAGWSGSLSGSTKPTTITMNSVKSVTANFANIQVTVGTSPSGRNISVDGAYYTSPQTFTWVVGSSHTISAPTPQSGGSGIQYAFTSWSDGGGQTHSYTVPGSNASVTANFKTQYYLNVSSSHGNPQGSGWYDSGANADFSVTSPDVQGTIKYLFLNWTGDASGTSTSGSVNMDGPKNVYANWNTQYYLNVVSSHGNPQGAGWYNSGATADFSVTTPDVQGSTRYLFLSWSGDFTGSSPSGSTSMTAAKIVTANWTTQYYLSTRENPDAGGNMTPVPPGAWFNSGTGAALAATVNPGYQWVGWSGDLSSPEMSVTIVMNGPKSVTANFTLTGKSRVQTNPEGLALVVDGVDCTSPQDFTWARGTSHTLAVPSPQSGGIGIRYVFKDWSDGGAQSHSITLDGAAVCTANFTTQYYLTTAENPGEGGDMTPPPPGDWYDSGDTVEVSATPNIIDGNVFSGWSGDITGTVNPAQVIMNGPKRVVANFGPGDGQAPFMKHCYPIPRTVSIPKNTEIQFKLADQEGGRGVDHSSIDLSVNERAIVAGGIDQTHGRVTITPGGAGYQFRYSPASDFTGGDTVTVRVRCRDLAHPANSMDSSFSFIVGSSRMTLLTRDTVDQSGGVVNDGFTGIQISIPRGALADTMEITVGFIDNPPALPDTLKGMGLVYHFGPDGLVFSDSVSVRIPYRQADLDSAGVTNPLDLPVFYYSTRTGGWTKLCVYQSTREYIFVKVGGFCYLGIGRLDLEPDAAEEKPLDIGPPASFGMTQNYPNPFNPETTIRYRMPYAGPVALMVYNMLGQKVACLFEGEKLAGSYKAQWDGRNMYGRMVGSGMYLVQMKTGKFTNCIKIIVNR